jgi:DNA replication protein DnaC
MTKNDQDLDEAFRELNLLRMAEVARETLRRCQDGKWSYKRLLIELIAEEKSYRRERNLQSRITKANLPEKWTLETFPFDRQPGVDRTQFHQLAELDFINQGTNLVFIGRPGVGKTGLATSLLMKALLNGHTGSMHKTQDLLDDLHRSIADRKTRYLLNRFSKTDMLVVDELGYLCLNTDQANLFFKLMDNRYRNKKSTLITTNLGYDAWSEHLGNPAMVNALLSRLKERCVTIVIEGPDLRSPR